MNNGKKWPDWIYHWITTDEDGKYIYFWPDNSQFGPFDSWEGAAQHLLDNADNYSKDSSGTAL